MVDACTHEKRNRTDAHAVDLRVVSVCDEKAIPSLVIIMKPSSRTSIEREREGEKCSIPCSDNVVSGVNEF